MKYYYNLYLNHISNIIYNNSTAREEETTTIESCLSNCWQVMRAAVVLLLLVCSQLPCERPRQCSSDKEHLVRCVCEHIDDRDKEGQDRGCVCMMSGEMSFLSTCGRWETTKTLMYLCRV
jgi:hypothetical protein